jgi:dihydrofolate reductase
MSDLEEFWETIDAIIVGRKTYDPVLKSGEPWPSYPGVKNYVFSRTIKKSSDKNVRIISEDAAEFVRKLKRKKGKDIFLMGGGELAKSLFQAKVIDEVSLSIQPVLLGSGVPLFLPMRDQVDMKLIASKRFKNGVVLVNYQVKGSRDA